MNDRKDANSSKMLSLVEEDKRPSLFKTIQDNLQAMDFKSFNPVDFNKLQVY